MIAQRHKRNYEHLKQTYRKIEDAKISLESEMIKQSEEYKRLKKEIKLLIQAQNESA